jgi:hypothetical protein
MVALFGQLGIIERLGVTGDARRAVEGVAGLEA